MTWRVGHKVPRNLYLDDEPVALLATPELAASIAGSLNERTQLRAEVVRLRSALLVIMGEITDDDHEDAGEDEMLDSLMKIHTVALDALRTTSASPPKGEP